MPALCDGDAAIVVATPAHCREFEHALEDAGIDVAGAVRDGRYLAFDARAVLSRFMRDGAPDGPASYSNGPRDVSGHVMTHCVPNERFAVAEEDLAGV